MCVVVGGWPLYEQKDLLSRFRKSVDGSYVVEDFDVFERMHNEWVGDNVVGFFRRLDEKGNLSIFMPFNTIGLDRAWVYEQILDNAIGGYGDNDSVKDSLGLHTTAIILISHFIILPNITPVGTGKL